MIDGLPELYGLLERIEQEALDGTRRQRFRRVQRIEQGMGRGVRSSQDHCVVLLIRAKLNATPASTRCPNTVLLGDTRAAGFGARGHCATEGQAYVRDRVDGGSLRDGRRRMARCQQISRCGRRRRCKPRRRDRGSTAQGSISGRSKLFDLAEQTVQEAVRKVTEKTVLGYLKLPLAEYVHHNDQVKSTRTPTRGCLSGFRSMSPILPI